MKATSPMASVFPPLRDAGATVGRDAAAGMATVQLGAETWAWHPSRREWMLLHDVTQGGIITQKGLWGLAEQVYGDGTQWRRIYDLPENKAIQGSDPNKGLYSGDRILVPGLSAPGALPSSGPSSPAQPSEPLPGVPIPTTPPPLPSVPLPPGLPAVLPVPGGGIEPATGGAGEVEPSWWTPGRTALVSLLAIGAVGGVAWAIAARSRRRQRRRARA